MVKGGSLLHAVLHSKAYRTAGRNKKTIRSNENSFRLFINLYLFNITIKAGPLMTLPILVASLLNLTANTMGKA